jgi:hypothetical protein
MENPKKTGYQKIKHQKKTHHVGQSKKKSLGSNNNISLAKITVHGNKERVSGKKNSRGHTFHTTNPLSKEGNKESVCTVTSLCNWVYSLSQWRR